MVSFSGLLLCIFGLTLSSFASSISVLYLTYGICFGIGASFTYFPTIIVLRKYFKRYLTLANGISASGSGLGTLALGPLIEHSVRNFGLRWMFRLCAATAAVLLLIHMLFIYIERKCQEDVEQVNRQPFLKHLRSTLFGKDIWCNIQYQIMVTSMAVFLFGYFVPYVHLVCKYMLHRCSNVLGHLQFCAFWSLSNLNLSFHQGFKCRASFTYQMEF